MLRALSLSIATAVLIGSTALAETPVMTTESQTETGIFQILNESTDVSAVDTEIADMDAQARSPRPRPPGYRPRPPRPNPIRVVGVRCGAPLYGTQYCSIGRQIRSVTLMRQWSAAPCFVRQTWGAFNTGVWTSHGCGGDFRIEY